MTDDKSELEQEIIDDYCRKPYALIIAVLLVMAVLIIGGKYLIILIGNGIFNLINLILK